MKFEARVFEEPELEFGENHLHIDARAGLSDAGPLQMFVGETIRISVVGSAKTIEDTKNFFDRAAMGINGGSEKHPNMQPPFPGLGNANPFRCKFEVVPNSCLALSQSTIDSICREPLQSKAVARAVDEFFQAIETIEEGSSRPNVVVVALPIKLIEKLWSGRTNSFNETNNENSGSDTNFRGMLKAKCMGLRSPIQIIWEDVIDPKAKVPQKIKASRNRKNQDEASVAWNLFPALYYKGSGRIPWRKRPIEGEYSACFIGISFYKDASALELYTSAAQMFDERGRGFVLRGRRALTESRGRHPYLSAEDAKDLVLNSLKSYKSHHKNFPARVIVLKTSRFRNEEADGIFDALSKSSIELKDLVWVQSLML